MACNCGVVGSMSLRGLTRHAGERSEEKLGYLTAPLRDLGGAMQIPLLYSDLELGLGLSIL